MLSKSSYAALFTEIHEELKLLGADHAHRRVHASFQDFFRRYYVKAMTAPETALVYHTPSHALQVLLCVLQLYRHSETAYHPTELGILIQTAIYHDAGFTYFDNRHSSAEIYTEHEHFSARILSSELSRKGYTLEYQQCCREVIYATILMTDFRSLPWSTAEAKALGRLLASADLLAQMSDRCYLERLALLYVETVTNNAPAARSFLSLLEGTTAFYTTVFLPRIQEQLDTLALSSAAGATSLKLAYLPRIQRNLEYLEFVLEESKKPDFKILRYLRRLSGLSGEVDIDKHRLQQWLMHNASRQQTELSS